MLELAGGPGEGDALDGAAELIWSRHLVDNLWSRPLPGVVESLEALRGAGLKLAVV